MVSKGFPNITTSGQQYNIGEKPSVILYVLFCLDFTSLPRPWVVCVYVVCVFVCPSHDESIGPQPYPATYAYTVANPVRGVLDWKISGGI